MQSGGLCEDRSFSFPEILGRLIDKFVEPRFIRSSVHGRIRVAAGPERFRRDIVAGSVIADQIECHDQRIEVERAVAQCAAIAIRDMEIHQLIARRKDGRRCDSPRSACGKRRH